MSSVDKMDLSLDQIIKLQRKEAKQTQGATGTRGRGGNRIRGCGRGGRGVGRPATSIMRRNENNTSGGSAASTNSTSPKTRGGERKFGVRANLTARRLLSNRRTIAAGKGGRAGRGGVGVGRSAFQRVAQNIVKRAIIQNRRMAFGQRRDISSNSQQRGGGQAASANTRRLVADVRHWRNTAKQLQQALQVQQQRRSPIRLRRNFATGRGSFRQAAVSTPMTDVKQRLGWRRTTDSERSPIRGGGRGGFGRRGRVGQASPMVKGRGNVGQMQSDLLVQNRQVAIRQQGRQQMDYYSRGRRQQRIGQGRNMGAAITANFNQSPQGISHGGRRGRGGVNTTRFSPRNNNFLTSFSQGGAGRPSLHERFGGNSTPAVRINTNNKGGFRGRSQRQIFF